MATSAPSSPGGVNKVSASKSVAIATNAFALGEARITGKIVDALTKQPIPTSQYDTQFMGKLALWTILTILGFSARVFFTLWSWFGRAKEMTQ